MCVSLDGPGFCSMMKVLEIALDFHLSGVTLNEMIENMCPGNGWGGIKASYSL